MGGGDKKKMKSNSANGKTRAHGPRGQASAGGKRRKIRGLAQLVHRDREAAAGWDLHPGRGCFKLFGMPTGKPNEAAPCAICNGSGWRMVAVEHNGRTVEQATRCDCVRQMQGERLLEAARIPRRYRHCELSNFEHEGPFRSLASAHMAALRFVEEFPLESAGLLLTGPIGCGKTHLAVGIAKELIAQKATACLFYDYRELLKEIQNSYNASVQVTEMEVLRPVFDAEVLVLDELGAAKPTEWVWDTVSHILNTRYNDKRTTIISTNYKDLPPAGAEPEGRVAKAAREETLGDRIGERMRSRLHEMCRVVRVEGEDFRMKYKSASLR
jgi:DNA replication protein DnaC